MKTTLTSEQLQLLRTRGILEKNEVAYQEGDIFVAEDVLSGAKRIITPNSVLSEASQKKVLFG